MDRQNPADSIQPVLYPTVTLVRLYRLQVGRRFFILGVDRMIREGTPCVFLTLRKCARYYIYKLVPLDPFSADKVCDINNAVAVGTVAYVGRDSANIIGMALKFNKAM